MLLLADGDWYMLLPGLCFFIIVSLILGIYAFILRKQITRYQDYIFSEPQGRLGFYKSTWTWKDDKGETDKKICIFKVEELDSIEQEGKSLTKVKYLEISTQEGSTRGLTVGQKSWLYENCPQWINTKEITWKKSDEQLLTDKEPTIRAKARHRLAKKELK